MTQAAAEAKSNQKRKLEEKTRNQVERTRDVFLLTAEAAQAMAAGTTVIHQTHRLGQ